VCAIVKVLLRRTIGNEFVLDAAEWSWRSLTLAQPSGGPQWQGESMSIGVGEVMSRY